mmetsp:Transcript_17564/g.19058  ORF Transcript_17564/g.19058 Transcript_17564/m.19058 type:complete len:101 (-) Transcript_17564:1180-1482(-)
MISMWQIICYSHLKKEFIQAVAIQSISEDLNFFWDSPCHIPSASKGSFKRGEISQVEYFTNLKESRSSNKTPTVTIGKIISARCICSIVTPGYSARNVKT